MESTMRVLTGYLYLNESDASGLRVKMRIAEDDLTVSNDHGPLGSWTPMATQVEEIGPERFRLLLGDEQLVFAPDDPVEFRYEIAPQLGPPEPRRSWRPSFKIRKAAHREDPPEPAVVEYGDLPSDPFVLALPAAQPRRPSRVAPERHEPLMAAPPDPPAPRSRPSKADPEPDAGTLAPEAKKPTPTPRHSPHRDPKQSPLAALEIERRLAAASQVASASLEKVKLAPAAISSGVRRILDRTPDDHRHQFSSNGIPGGLVRYVCTDCGHVSVDLTDEAAAASSTEGGLFSRGMRL